MKDVQRYTGKPGEIVTLEPANPAAGSQYVLAVPAGFIYRLRGGKLLFTCSATVANRTMIFEWTAVLGTMITKWRSATNQTAGTAVLYTLNPDNTDSERSISNDRYIPSFPKIIVPENCEWRTAIINIQAGDQLSGIVLQFERWRL